MTWATFSNRSGKREVAVSLLLLWAFISGYVFFWIPPANFKDYADGYSTVTWAVLAWAAAAFGLDFVAKSGMIGGAKPEPKRRAVDRDKPGPL